MTIILPDGPVDEFVASLTAESWINLKNLYSNSEVYVKLPRFTVNCDGFSLNETLKSIGFESNFADETTYDLICKGLPGNSLNVNHSAILKVDEAGSEGAAATWEGWYGDPSGPTQEPIYFTADRPFIFIIDEVSTGAVLFAGVVNEM